MGQAATDASPLDTWTTGQTARYLGTRRERVYRLFWRGELEGYQPRERAWLCIYPDSAARFRECEEARKLYAQRYKERHVVRAA
jgi:hypothetical protein